MTHRMAAVLIAAGLLGGCSSWDELVRYPSQKSQSAPESAAPAPEPVASVSAPVVADKSPPFVAVPVAPPLAPPNEVHNSLRAGTTTPPPASPTVQAVPTRDAAASDAPPITSEKMAPTAPPPPAIAPSPAYTATAPVAAAPPASPQASEIAADSWCARVAKSAQAEAAEQGFDAATQQRRALSSFKQCAMAEQTR